MHQWGKEGVDWKGINDAADFIHVWLERGGISVAQSKEKWGMVVVYTWGYPSWPWKKFWYKLVYRLAFRKWPHLRKEMLHGADYPELLPGGEYLYKEEK